MSQKLSAIFLPSVGNYSAVHVKWPLWSSVNSLMKKEYKRAALLAWDMEHRAGGTQMAVMRWTALFPLSIRCEQNERFSPHFSEGWLFVHSVSFELQHSLQNILQFCLLLPELWIPTVTGWSLSLVIREGLHFHIQYLAVSFIHLFPKDDFHILYFTTI